MQQSSRLLQVTLSFEPTASDRPEVMLYMVLEQHGCGAEPALLNALHLRGSDARNGRRLRRFSLAVSRLRMRSAMLGPDVAHADAARAFALACRVQSIHTAAACFHSAGSLVSVLRCCFCSAMSGTNAGSAAARLRFRQRVFHHTAVAFP